MADSKRQAEPAKAKRFMILNTSDPQRAAAQSCYKTENNDPEEIHMFSAGSQGTADSKQ